MVDDLQALEGNRIPAHAIRLTEETPLAPPKGMSLLLSRGREPDVTPHLLDWLPECTPYQSQQVITVVLL
jgi:hypothetical protein